MVRVTDLANAAAVLANRGVHPTNGEQVLDPGVVRDVISVAMTCGLYTGAGRWVVRTGVPAKSGVSGGLMAIGRQLGMAALSPPLDENGNTVRGVQAIARLADLLDLHPFGGPSRLGPHLET